jgi:hypothetical protein
MKPQAYIHATGFFGPTLLPDDDSCFEWDEKQIPYSPPEALKRHLDPALFRRGGRYIKSVVMGAMLCLQKFDSEKIKSKKVGLFLGTGLGNVVEIVPFASAIASNDGSHFPSPVHFANSVANSAAFYVMRAAGFTGINLTISQEDLSFESALLASLVHLQAGDVDFALVGGCDLFFAPSEYHAKRMNYHGNDWRLGEGSAWVLLSRESHGACGELFDVQIGSQATARMCQQLEPFLKLEIPKSQADSSMLVGHSFRFPPDTSLSLNMPLKTAPFPYLAASGAYPTASAFALCSFLQGPVGQPQQLFMHVGKTEEGIEGSFLVRKLV